MQIDKNLLSKLCDLAGLKITPEEEKTLQTNLTEVLSHFQKISALDTEGTAPLFNPLEKGALPLREDTLQDFADKEDCLNQTAHRSGRLFKTISAI